MTEPDHLTAEKQQHDERAKLLFSHERPVLELLAHLGALPKDREVRLVSWKTEWIAVQHGTDRVPTRLARELGDQVWLVCELDGRPLCTVLLEFKAEHDPNTARQITLYLFDLWQDARRLAALRIGADAVPTRAALIYTGEHRWTADLFLPAVAPNGTITPQPGIFLLDIGRTEPGTFPEGSLLAHIIPLERCRGRLQWERGVDETAVVAEISRLWENLRPLAEGDASLWQVLAAWLRTGLADYIQGMKLEGGDGSMYATIEEAYAARRAQDEQRISKRISIESRTDYVRERHGEDAATAVAAFLADWQDSRLPTFGELDALAALQQDGQDPQTWWMEQRRLELPNAQTNGSAPSQPPK